MSTDPKCMQCDGSPLRRGECNPGACTNVFPWDITVFGSLETIQRSLEPKPTVKQEEQKTAKAADLTDALLQLPEIQKQLTALAMEKRRESDILGTFERIDMDIQSVANKADESLRRLTLLEESVKKRLEQIDANETRHQHLVNRINTMLDDLERVLKRI